METSTDLQLIDIRQASALLNINRFTLYHYVRKGQVPYVSFGKLIRFNKADLLGWVKERTIPAKI